MFTFKQREAIDHAMDTAASTLDLIVAAMDKGTVHEVSRESIATLASDARDGLEDARRLFNGEEVISPDISRREPYRSREVGSLV